MAQGPSDTILVAIRITLWIPESKVRNPDPPDWQRFVLSECSLVRMCYVVRLQSLLFRVCVCVCIILLYHILCIVCIVLHSLLWRINFIIYP